MDQWTLESGIPGCPCCMAHTGGLSYCSMVRAHTALWLAVSVSIVTYACANGWTALSYCPMMRAQAACGSGMLEWLALHAMGVAHHFCQDLHSCMRTRGSGLPQRFHLQTPSGCGYRQSGTDSAFADAAGTQVSSTLGPLCLMLSYSV